MNYLITLTDIYTITGLSSSTLGPLIAYAEAQAEAMLGFLHKGSKVQNFFTWDKTDTFKLDLYPINSVTSITQKVSADTDLETFETTDFIAIEDQGLIIFDTEVAEKVKVAVTYDIGWDADTVTSLVKLFLVILTVNQYYSLNPDLTQHSEVLVSEKIGDYAVKYANVSKGEFKSLDDWTQYLAALIRKGGMGPDVQSV